MWSRLWRVSLTVKPSGTGSRSATSNAQPSRSSSAPRVSTYRWTSRPTFMPRSWTPLAGLAVTQQSQAESDRGQAEESEPDPGDRLGLEPIEVQRRHEQYQERQAERRNQEVVDRRRRVFPPGEKRADGKRQEKTPV